MKEMSHKVFMLRPMYAGASGFARMQRQGRRMILQIRVRGIGTEGFRAFWYQSGSEPLELGSTICDARGEAILTTETPEDSCSLLPARLQALLIVENKQQPNPLLIGLCAEGSAGSMTDVRNACLTLCDKLRLRKKESDTDKPVSAAPMPVSSTEIPIPDKHKSDEEKPSEETDDSSVSSLPSTPSPISTQVFEPKVEKSSRKPDIPLEEIRKALLDAGSFSRKGTNKNGQNTLYPKTQPTKPREYDPPREIFLTAIDPLPYVEAAEINPPLPEVSAPVNDPPAPDKDESAEPADTLPELVWPSLARPLRDYFTRCPPTGLFPLPGWRFVCASRQGDGLWIGRLAENGIVTRIAYVMQGAPAADGEYQPLKGTDGLDYRALVQRI